MISDPMPQNTPPPSKDPPSSAPAEAPMRASSWLIYGVSFAMIMATLVPLVGSVLGGWWLWQKQWLTLPQTIAAAFAVLVLAMLLMNVFVLGPIALLAASNLSGVPKGSLESDLLSILAARRRAAPVALESPPERNAPPTSME